MTEPVGKTPDATPPQQTPGAGKTEHPASKSVDKADTNATATDDTSTNQDVQSRQEVTTYNTARQTSQLIQPNTEQVVIYTVRVAGAPLQDNRQQPAEGQRPHQEEARHEHGRTEGHGHGKKNVGGGGRVVGEEKIHSQAGEMAIRSAKFGDKPLSPFEKALVGRFEEGKHQAKDAQDGEAHFLKKSAGEWVGFFEKFLSRTMQKVVGWSEVNGFLFRGLLQEKGMPQKGVMISDVLTEMGTDKFARIAVPMGKAMQLAGAAPGLVVSKETMQGMLGDQLRYLALNPQLGEEGAVRFAQAASRGMFTNRQLENRVAENLGLLNQFRGSPHGIESQHAQTERAARERRRRGGMWSRLFGEDDVGGEGSVFIPWWRWDREERSGSRRWFVAVFGSVIFVVLIFLVIALVRVLRP